MAVVTKKFCLSNISKIILFDFYSSVLAFVGFMARRCVYQHRNTTTMMCNNLSHTNGSLEAISNNSGQAKTILQQQVDIFLLR